MPWQAVIRTTRSSLAQICLLLLLLVQRAGVLVLEDMANPSSPFQPYWKSLPPKDATHCSTYTIPAEYVHLLQSKDVVSDRLFPVAQRVIVLLWHVDCYGDKSATRPRTSSRHKDQRGGAVVVIVIQAFIVLQILQNCSLLQQQQLVSLVHVAQQRTV